ncbi:unnamed protein product [Adineta steineri]|uniref:Uncharacterized protein n=1 Tax=Adineta steineri TaxID=433720 RepID=A0A819EIZ8_9BILA|nr:unnamed protein product [Adineta steineri]
MILMGLLQFNKNQSLIIIFGKDDNVRSLLKKTLIDVPIPEVDEGYYTIKFSPSLGGFDNENFDSYCAEIKQLFDSNPSTILLFITDTDVDQKINVESIVTFKFLNDVYHFNKQSFLFIINDASSNQDQNDIKEKLEKLLDIKDIQYDESKMNSWTHEDITKLKKEVEKKQNSLVHLLKEIKIEVEENGDLCMFSYKDIQYYYDNDENTLSCSNDQGIKILNKTEFDILKYLLKRAALFNKSKKVKENLEKGELDETIRDFLTQQNEHIEDNNSTITTSRLEEINKMITTLEDDINDSKDENIRELKNKLDHFEQCLENIRKLENDIREKTEEIQKLNKNVVKANKVMQENDEDLDDLLQMNKLQFEHLDPYSTFLKDQYERQINQLEHYRSSLADENKKKQFNSETSNFQNRITTHDQWNVENKSESLRTTVSSLENNELQVGRLEKELSALNRNKTKAELDLRERNIINKVKVIEHQLNYSKHLPKIKDLQEKSILLNKSSHINSRTHYGFDLRGKRYAFQLPDPENEQTQQNIIKEINDILKLVDLIDNQLIKLKAEKQNLIEQSKASSEEKNLSNFKNIENFLLTRFIRLSSFDRFTNRKILNEMECFISILISEIIDRPHLYETDGFNQLDPILEQGLQKIVMKLKDLKDFSTVISEINKEYSDEGYISKVVVFELGKENEYLPNISNLKVHNKKELFLLKHDTLYFVLKHHQAIRLIDNETLNLKLNINKNLSDLSNETNVLEDLCQKRIKITYKRDLQKSNKLAQFYQNEIDQLGQIHSIKEFNAAFSSYTNEILFYFLSHLDENFDRLEFKLNKFDSEFEEISNFSLIKIKDLYKTAINKVLLDEQERRKQIRLEKITTKENEEIQLTNLIQEDEEREKQLLAKLAEKQEEIYKTEFDLNKIIGQLTQSKEFYKTQEQLNKLSEDMIKNQLAKSFLGPSNGQLVSELGIDMKGNTISVKKFKISVSGNVSYKEIYQNLKDTIEREIKCQNGGLFFDKDVLKVKPDGINLLNDLPKEIQSITDDRIKIDYQQHEWEDRLNREYDKAVEQLNELNIDYKQIVCCYVDQIEILCANTFLLDSSDYYPGIDLIIRAKQMKCGNEGKSVKLITTGFDAREFRFKQASDGSKKRTYPDAAEGRSGYDGEFGRDGQHAGNIFIKIDEIIENLELLESIELSGGKGASGQLGGNGDKGHRGKDGENGQAEDTRSLAGGQTTFGVGQSGTQSGDGGNAGFSGHGGKGGQSGKLSIGDNEGDRFEQIKDRIVQREGLTGIDPDLSSSNAPKGGEGGEPTITGMDQVKNKNSFIRKTTTENGEIDIPYLLEKNPELRKEIEKSGNFGNRGMPTPLTVAFILSAPIIIAALPLLINCTIRYRMSKNEKQYKLNPRRDKNTKGKSKENERSRFRQENKKESETVKRDFPITSNLDRSLLEKCKELSENIEENHYDEIVNRLKSEKQVIDNKITEYRAQEHSLESDINLKQQIITQLEIELNKYQNRLDQLREENVELTQEQLLKIGQELELMTRQQDLRDRMNEKQLTQKISITNLQKYSELCGQYQREYNKMKDTLNEYKSVKEALLKKQHEEKARIENELAKLNTNLRENRKKLTRFKDEKLKLLKEETILTEDVLQKTQEEVQYEHEFEINCLSDKDIEIPRIRKNFLNKIEKVTFTPFVQKSINYEDLPFFRTLNDFLSQVKDDRSLEDMILWLVKGIHHSYVIDMNQINESIKNMKAVDDDLKSNEIFVDFVKQIEFIILNHFNNKNEETMFSYLDKNFLDELSKFRKELGDFNGSLLITIENGLKNIKEKQFLQQINIIDDVEQLIEIFDSRKLFRLESSSIDFHHINLSLTELESAMLKFNKEPTFEQLISLTKKYRSTRERRQYFYVRYMGHETKFLEVISDNFDYFAQNILDQNLLDKFESAVKQLPKRPPPLHKTRQNLLKRIENKKNLNRLIACLQKTNLSSKSYDNIVKKLLSSDVNLNDAKRKSIENKIKQNKDNNFQSVYRELCSLIDSEEQEVKHDQLNERNQDMSFIEKIKQLIREKSKNVKLENTPLLIIEKSVETILLEVLYELDDIYNDESLRDKAIIDYKKQVEFILRPDELSENFEKCLFMFQTLCKQGYFYNSSLATDVSQNVEQKEIENSLFELDYNYHYLRYDLENAEKSKRFEYIENFNEYFEELKKIKENLLEQTNDNCFFQAKQICLRLYDDLKDDLFRLRVEKDLSSKNIIDQIDLYFENKNEQKDDEWNKIEKILSDILADSSNKIEEIFENLCKEDFKKHFKCLLNSFNLESLSNSFEIIRKFKQILDKNQVSNDFHEILLLKYFQICEMNALSVTTSLNDLSKKLDKIEYFENAIHRVLTTLSDEFGFDTTQVEFYSQLKKLIDEVQLLYERHLEFADKFNVFQSNEKDFQHIKDALTTEKDIKKIQFFYKGQEKIFDISNFKDEERKDWLKYLSFVHESTTTDQVLEKIKIDYLKQIESLRKDTADKQLEQFLNKYNQNESSDKQIKFLEIIISDKKDELLLELLYHLKSSVTFKFEHEQKLSDTIIQLKTLDQEHEFDQLIIILEEHENNLLINLVESLCKPISDKQKSTELELWNKKKNIIHQYGLDLHQKHKKKLIELYLEIFDKVLEENSDDGDLFYKKRIEMFNLLLEDIKDKSNEEIEETLALHLNQQIFRRLEKSHIFEENIIDSNHSVIIPNNTGVKRIFSSKKFEYFFDKNGRFLTETAEKLNEYSVQVTLNNQEKVYNLSWNNSDEFDEKYQILNDLYASYRIKLFREAIENFKSNFTETKFLSNVIEITKHLTYLFRSNTKTALIKSDTTIDFLKDFYSIVVDAMFPNKDDQVILSDFILALDCFLEKTVLPSNGLKEEIEKLKICLKNKIYKELNYVLVEKEYEEFIQKRQQNPILSSSKLILPTLKDVFFLMNTFHDRNKMSFLKEFKTNFPHANFEQTFNKKALRDIEKLLNSKKEELLEPEPNDPTAPESINLTDICSSIDMKDKFLKISSKNLIILKMKLNEHFDKLQLKKIKNLFKTLNKINQSNNHLSDLKCLLTDFYISKWNTQIKEKFQSNKDNAINELKDNAENLCNKLFQIFNNRTGYEKLLDHFDEVYSHIEENPENTLYKIIDENFDIDSETISENNLFDVLPFDYLYRKKKLCIELLKKTEDLNNNEKYLMNLVRYCCLFCSLDENENQTFIRFYINNKNQIEIIVNCLKNIIDNTLDIRSNYEQPDPNKDEKEILLNKVNETIEICYLVNNQERKLVVDDKQDVDILSSLCFDRNKVSREIFEKNRKIVYRMIQVKGEKNLIDSNENRIIEYIKLHLNEIKLSTDDTMNEQLTKLTALFCSYEERQQIEWILSFTEKTKQTHELDKLFQKPVLSWLEELNVLKIELVKKKMLQEFSTSEEEKDTEIIDKFHNAFKVSQFFAKDCSDDWLEIMVEISTNKSEKISLTELIKIISLLSDFQDLSFVKQIVTNYKTNSWLYNILFIRIEENLKIMLRKDLGIDLENKLIHMKRKLRFKMDKKCLFLDVFGQLFLEYKNQESRLLENNLKQFLIEFFDLVMDSRVDLDEKLLNELSLKSLSLWRLPLEKKILYKDLNKIHVFKNAIEIDKCTTVDYLYKIREEKGNEILTNLLDLIKNIEKEIHVLHDLNKLLEELTFGGFILDKNSLEKLKNKAFDEWRGILKDYTEKQLYELDVERLVEVMKEKVGEGKINESIKHLLEGQSGETKINQLLERIYSFYGERFNEKEKTLRDHQLQSKICTSLSNKPIINWTKFDIRQWANKLRENKRSNKEYFHWESGYLSEMIAIITRTVEICYGYYPRNIQLIALAIFLEPNSSKKGRLGNISTGEGKSLITAMLAVSHALIGNKVDIVTSSKVLAIRDASNDSEEGYKKFFNLFGLNVSNNCDNACDNPKTGQALRKERYQENEIIYGETGYFQRDILLTKFFSKDIRDRIGDILIVDEVDNMFIDNAEKILYISHSITDMRHLRDLFIHIWVTVHNKVEQSYSEENVNKIHEYIQLMIKNKDLKIPSTMKTFVDVNLKTWILNAYSAKYIENNDNYIIGDVESSKHGEILIMDKDTGVEQLNTRWSNGLHQFLQLKHNGKLSDESLKAVFMSNMNFFKIYDNLNGMSGTVGDQEERKLLSLEYGTDCFELPRFRIYRFQYEKSREFVGKNESEWCEQIIEDINIKMNASCQISQNEKNEIEKIKEESEDLLHNTVKNALEKASRELDDKKSKRSKLSEEINTFEKEKKSLTEDIQKLSADNDVKESKKKYKPLQELQTNINEKRKEIDAIDRDISSSKEDFVFHQTQQVKLERHILDYDQILSSRNDKDKRRAVLIICKNIADLEKIAAEVRKVFQSTNNIYTYDRAYRKFEKNVLNPGDIIIATNIAGRGTDLAIDKLLEVNGGLHVILTYIPRNLRVQQQAFGRTARSGKRGTGVYIVHDSRKTGSMSDMTVDFLLSERDEKEKERLEEVVRKSFPKIKIENILFEKFNLFKEEIKYKIQEMFSKSNEFVAERVFLLNDNDSDFDFNTNCLELQLNSLQNHWAFWLNEMDETLSKVHETGSNLILEKIDEFKNKILKELDSNIYSLITEPAELIKLSKLFMDSKKYFEAQDCYNEIIEKHPDFSDIAHYYKAFCIIHLGGGDKEAKVKAKIHLKKALTLLESKRSTIMSRIQILLSLNHMTQQKGQGLNVNYFKKQNEGEAQILSYHINAILEAIGNEISSENFRTGTITGGIPTEIHQELLKDDYDIIKDSRISKKIIIGSKVLITPKDEKWVHISDKQIESLLLNKGELFTYENFRKIKSDGSEYRQWRSELQRLGILSSVELYKKCDDTQGDPQCITFPDVFKYCQEEVLNDLESVLIQSQQHNWSYKKRIIKENFFETKVFHKDIFLLATQDIVKQREMIKISDCVRDDLVGKLDDPILHKLGHDIKNLLLGKKSISLSSGDRINWETFFKIICKKLNLNDKEKYDLKDLLSDIFEEKIEIGSNISETLKENIKNKLEKTVFAEKTSQIQDVIQRSLSDEVMLSLSIGDIIQKTTLISALKQFTHAGEISDKQVLNILTYLESNEILRINENLNSKFADSTNDHVFCGKKEAIKKFFLGKESYTLTSEEKVSLESGENKLSKVQLIEVMKKIGIIDKEKIDNIFKHLDLEFDSVKFINSYTEFYLGINDIGKIKEYLSKVSFTFENERKEEIKAKIKTFDFNQIGSLNNKSKHIIKTLLEAIESNKSDLTANDFCLNQEEFELLRGILQDNGLIEPKLYELLSKYDNDNSSIRNKRFYSNLENILIILYYNNGRISQESLSLRTANEVSKQLWYRLRESAVLKEAKVHFKFTSDPEKRLESIRKQVENVVVKVFGLKREDDMLYTIADWTGFGDLSTSTNKKLDEYIDSITTTLKQCAGVLRILSKVKIGKKNLKTMFQTGQIPPELMDYLSMCFDSVLSLKENKGLWNWDAFKCAMIGVAQIVAGIALDICTCGAAHYFAQVLISEGIGDIVFAIQSSIQGNFSWKAYSQHKVQSLIISLITAGVGSYLSKGAQAGKMTISLATKTALLKAVSKETLTHLITGVASAIVNITTDELSEFVMSEMVDKHFAKSLDEWIVNDAIYKEKKMTLSDRFENIYKKFCAVDAKNIINDSIQATLLDLQQGDLAKLISDRVVQITHGISEALSSAAQMLQNNKGKAALFGSIAKVLSKVATGARICKSFIELYKLCCRFCEILDKKLLNSFNNKKVKSDIEKIKEENTNMSISANISEHIKSMEDQMKTAVKEKVKNDFLKPTIQFTLNYAVQPIKEFISSPFADARVKLDDHINKRADEFTVLMEEKGAESLKKLSSGKIRALEQLGCLIDANDLESKYLDLTVCNLNGQSITELKKQYGDNVRIALKNGKLLALIPTYKEYMDNIENGIYAGYIHFKLAEEKYKRPIELVDPENGFQPHKDAPNSGTINSTKTKNGKPVKVAYIKSEKEGEPGHFAPVIEVNGKLKVVDITQNADTKDKCFAQTMLFHEKYNEGKETNFNFDSAHDYGIITEDIRKFNKDLAQFGKGSNSVRQDYHEGGTVKHSQFLGGARQEQRPFEERVHSNSTAGSYGSLDRRWRGRKGIYEINHIPPKASYRDTPYQDISIYHMPAIAMFIEDHRAKVHKTDRISDEQSYAVLVDAQ